MLEKVVAFITRTGSSGQELLLFRHPYAGIQIPAGTVEEGEMPEQAALREACEETGLCNLDIIHYIGHRDERWPEDVAAIQHRTTVYARPDTGSFDWAILPRGIQVKIERREPGFAQVTYEEWDQAPAGKHAISYVTYRITGWVPDRMLATGQRRHFFHLAVAVPDLRENSGYQDLWQVTTDSHRFELFWAPWPDLPTIVEPQSQWLGYVQESLGYSFSR